jgi:hypothetical protein
MRSADAADRSSTGAATRRALIFQAAGLIEQHRLTVCHTCASGVKACLLQHPLRGDMIGLDHRDDAINL